MARPKSDIEPRIIAAARDRFLHEGVDGASLRQIAKDAGTSIGMIYYYYPTKDDLFLGVVEDIYARVIADLSVALGPDVSVEERIGRLYGRLGALTDVEFTVIRIVIREALVSSSRLERLMERFSRGHLPLIIRTVSEGIEQKVIRADVPLPILIAVMGSIGIGPQLLRRILGDQSPAFMAALPTGAALAEQLLGLFFEGGGPARGDGPNGANGKG